MRSHDIRRLGAPAARAGGRGRRGSRGPVHCAPWWDPVGYLVCTVHLHLICPSASAVSFVASWLRVHDAHVGVGGAQRHGQSSGSLVTGKQGQGQSDVHAHARWLLRAWCMADDHGTAAPPRPTGRWHFARRRVKASEGRRLGCPMRHANGGRRHAAFLCAETTSQSATPVRCAVSSVVTI